MSAYPCGNHWKKYERAPVYERPDGLRVHIQGLIRTPDGNIITIEYLKMKRYQRIKGGNRKRGMMALATKEYPEESA